MILAAQRALLETGTIITIDSNEVIEPIHSRMPVILPRSDYGRWLDFDPAQPPIDLLRPYPAEEMKAWMASQRVGNARHNAPDLREERSE